MRSVRDTIALALAGATLAAVVVVALQHRLHPLFREATWHAVSRAFPGAAYGYVMFDTIPSRLPYYRLSRDGSPLRVEESDRNGSPGYQTSRFQMNSLLDAAYLVDVCRNAGHDFDAALTVRNLLTGKDDVLKTRHCRSGVLTDEERALR